MSCRSIVTLLLVIERTGGIRHPPSEPASRPLVNPAVAFQQGRGTLETQLSHQGCTKLSRKGGARWQREPADEQVRDGLIQRFEFTDELSHKLPRGYLEEAAASPGEINRMPFADLIPTANAQGLLRGDGPRQALFLSRFGDRRQPAIEAGWRACPPAARHYELG